MCVCVCVCAILLYVTVPMVFPSLLFLLILRAHSFPPISPLFILFPLFLPSFSSPYRCNESYAAINTLLTNAASLSVIILARKRHKGAPWPSAIDVGTHISTRRSLQIVRLDGINFGNGGSFPQSPDIKDFMITGQGSPHTGEGTDEVLKDAAAHNLLDNLLLLHIKGDASLQTISHDWVHRLAQLTHMSFRGNQINAVPDSLFNLPLLKFIDLTDNNLRNVSAAAMECSNNNDETLVLLGGNPICSSNKNGSSSLPGHDDSRLDQSVRVGVVASSGATTVTTSELVPRGCAVTCWGRCTTRCQSVLLPDFIAERSGGIGNCNEECINESCGSSRTMLHCTQFQNKSNEY